MTLLDTYDYLARARRDLGAALEAAPEDLLARDLIGGPRFRSIKDLLFHVIEVEDGWVNVDIRGGAFIQDAFPDLRQGGPDFGVFALTRLLAYWRAVEASTRAYLATLTDADLPRVVPVDDWPGKRLTVDGLLSHVLIHEMRHTAQIALLLRMQGLTPPALDLLFYLPPA